MISNYIDLNRLKTFAEKNKRTYVQNKPFPHIVIDNFLIEEMAIKLSKEFPQNIKNWRKGDDMNYKKRGNSSFVDFPSTYQETISVLQSSPFLNFLEQLTNKDNLIADPKLSGGGLHVIETGGHLKMHSDYLIHQDYNLRRKLNLILFVNENWKKSWGGALELWDRKMRKCVVKTYPILNRCVIFDTENKNFHGHPSRLKCPENISRRSIALYYYISEKKYYSMLGKHLFANWKKRPNETFKNKLSLKEVLYKSLPLSLVKRKK